MGNLKYLAEGVDFAATSGDFPKEFGFSGSNQGYDSHPAAPPFAGSKSTDNGKHLDMYAKGGNVHPHGHQVASSEHRPDGSVIMHHAHGGYTVCHADGGMTHHGHDGQPMMAGGGRMGGIENMHDSSELAHRATGGTVQPYAKGGEEHLAKGGIGHRQHLPRGMKPKAEHFRPLGEESALNRPPRNPMHSTTPRNAMPGGQMAYGVEPSAEPDMPPPGGMTQLARGGRARKMEE